MKIKNGNDPIWNEEQDFVHVLERAYCFRSGCRHYGEPVDEAWYDRGKSHWKACHSMLADIRREANLMLVQMPACACGEPFGAPVHDNIVSSTDPTWSAEQQHPYGRPHAP